MCSAIDSCPLCSGCSKIMFVSHTPRCSFPLPSLTAWNSHPSPCLSHSLLCYGSASLRTSSEPIWIEVGDFLWAPVALCLLCGRRFMVLLPFSSLCRELLYCSLALSPALNAMPNPWKSSNKYMLGEKNEAMNTIFLLCHWIAVWVWYQ